jgi:oxygen-independent coproporphyrinogen-3 oxidase
LATLKSWGFLVDSSTHLGLTRDGLLQVDRLLQEFFKPEHRTGRYA